MILLGNMYLGFFETAVPDTFAALKGQGTFSETRSPAKIDTSSKTDQGFSTGAFGNINWSGALDVKVSLPDAVYTRLETQANSNTPFMFAIRKNGRAGVDADAIFKAMVYATARAKLPDVFAFANALGGGTPAHPTYATDPAYGAKIAAVMRMRLCRPMPHTRRRSRSDFSPPLGAAEGRALFMKDRR